MRCLWVCYVRVPPEQLALTILRHPVPSSNMLVCAWNLHCEPYASCRNWHLFKCICKVYQILIDMGCGHWRIFILLTFLLILKRYYFPKFGMTVKLERGATSDDIRCEFKHRQAWAGYSQRIPRSSLPQAKFAANVVTCSAPLTRNPNSGAI